MCMAIDLIKRNKCHNFIIVEKSTSIGGTWHDNKYPGCCCDVWSMLYSYSFEQNPDWTREYPGQEEILVSLFTFKRSDDLLTRARNISVASQINTSSTSTFGLILLSKPRHGMTASRAGRSMSKSQEAKTLSSARLTQLRVTS